MSQYFAIFLILTAAVVINADSELASQPETFLYENEVQQIVECLQTELQCLNDIDIPGAIGAAFNVEVSSLKLGDLMKWTIENLVIRIDLIGGAGVKVNVTLKWQEFGIYGDIGLDAGPISTDLSIVAGVKEVVLDIYARVKLNTDPTGLPIKIILLEPTLNVGAFYVKFGDSMQKALELIIPRVCPGETSTGNANEDLSILFNCQINSTKQTKVDCDIPGAINKCLGKMNA